MLVYCWKSDDHYCLNANYPRIAKADDPPNRRHAGDIIGDIGTVCAVFPADLDPFLPGACEIRAMRFHVDLWGKAKELPSYDKKLWMSLQRMLGE